MRWFTLFRTVHWKVVIIYILLILMAMQVIGAYFIREVEHYYMDNFSETLHSHANLLAVNLERYLDEQADTGDQRKGNQNVKSDIDYLVSNLVALQGAEVQVIDQNGIVLSTTEKEKAIIGQKNTRTEVNMALLGTRIESIKVDPDTRQRVTVLTLPVKKGNQIVGAIYMVASMEEMYQTMEEINRILATGTGIAMLLTGTLGVFLSRTITRPVIEITKQATAMAEGDFNRRVRVFGEDEIGKLGETFNVLTQRLKEAISQKEEERDKLSSVLTNMSDGVIAADKHGKILLMNQRAQQLLNLSGDYENRLLYDALNLSQPEKEGVPISRDESSTLVEVTADGVDPWLIRVTFSNVQSQGEDDKGIIAVLQDVTEQEKLEQERKEFVANVSHELRTPLTTMKSYLEALDDGALQDEKIAPKFIKVVMNENERMIRLVHDLLQLSRLDSKAAQLKRKPVSIGKLIDHAVYRFAIQGEQQGLRIETDFHHAATKVDVDPDSIHQVLDNLLSNAIKYSNQEGTITVRTEKVNDYEMKVEIEDQGVGIPPHDLSRIFNRFYRVDKARSRKMGGTGLGLSIAREIIRNHGGMIHIDSKVNQGTNVVFTLPIDKGDRHE